ncbi:hypothetical protein [Kitasatospora sp. MBT66]|uniref:DUF7919 family protein n=1 Tax=Kitasatospora sp. MBT66 TaxID=1444769 RepID=UPI0005B76C8B|nr:hypothetical protein [Kitasatospora sp. MBT66]
MTYYPDGSPYTYHKPGEGMVNVGWLDDAHDYQQGEVAEEVVDGLLRLVIDPDNQTRGLHECDFCGALYLMVDNPHAESGSSLLGTAEIHVRSSSDTVFVAPTLVIHYIVEHGYRPPDEFLDAVEVEVRRRSVEQV